MTTLNASRAAQKAHAKKQRQGHIPSQQPAVDVQALRARITEAIAQTTDPRERARLRRVLLEMHANHGLKEPVFPTAPTPQLVARYGGRYESEVVVPGSGPVRDLCRHTLKPLVETNKKAFSESDLEVFRRVYEDAQATVGVNITQNYGGASGGSRPWEKLGGLGHVSELDRIRHARFNQVYRCIPGRKLKQALRWLILEYRDEGMDTLPNMAEAGRRWAPTIGHEATRKGISIGVLLVLAEILRQLYEEH